MKEEQRDELSHLKILGEGKRNKWNQKTFRCKCKCGNIKDILVFDVINNRSRSCGCRGLTLLKKNDL